MAVFGGKRSRIILLCYCSRAGGCWPGLIPLTELALVDSGRCNHIARRDRNIGLLSSLPRSPLFAIERRSRKHTYILHHIQCVGRAYGVGGKSSPSSRESRYGRRRIQPASRRLLVGAPAVGLSMVGITAEPLVPRHGQAQIQGMEAIAKSNHRAFHIFRTDPGMGSLLLARSYPAGLRAALSDARK